MMSLPKSLTALSVLLKQYYKYWLWSICSDVRQIYKLQTINDKLIYTFIIHCSISVLNGRKENARLHKLSISFSHLIFILSVILNYVFNRMSTSQHNSSMVKPLISLKKVFSIYWRRWLIYVYLWLIVFTFISGRV